MIEDELIGLIAKGDEDAFEQLYAITHKKVFRYLYRLTNNQQTAEDIMIETYAETWKSARKFRGRSKVLTWIIGIARNLAMNEFRKQKVNECDIEEFQDQLSTQAVQADVSGTEELLAKAINKLSPKHREVLDLVFFQGMKYEEVAQITGASLNTVKTRIFYAKEELRKILKGMGIEKDGLI